MGWDIEDVERELRMCEARLAAANDNYDDAMYEVKRLQAQVRQLEQLLGDFPDELLAHGE